MCEEVEKLATRIINSKPCAFFPLESTIPIIKQRTFPKKFSVGAWRPKISRWAKLSRQDSPSSFGYPGGHFRGVFVLWIVWVCRAKKRIKSFSQKREFSRCWFIFCKRENEGCLCLCCSFPCFGFCPTASLC